MSCAPCRSATSASGIWKAVGALFLRQFLLRGVEIVRAESARSPTTHDLLKLFTFASAA
jgi:hypothetical protein